MGGIKIVSLKLKALAWSPQWEEDSCPAWNELWHWQDSIIITSEVYVTYQYLSHFITFITSRSLLRFIHATFKYFATEVHGVDSGPVRRLNVQENLWLCYCTEGLRFKWYDRHHRSSWSGVIFFLTNPITRSACCWVAGVRQLLTMHHVGRTCMVLLPELSRTHSSLLPVFGTASTVVVIGQVQTMVADGNPTDEYQGMVSQRILSALTIHIFCDIWNTQVWRKQRVMQASVATVCQAHHFQRSIPWYCWWTKSCTTKDDDYPIMFRVLTIPGGAGFRPSTVVSGSHPAEYDLSCGREAQGFI